MTSQAQDEKISIETCLFLLECLQSIEENRMPMEQLSTHPFVQEELKDVPLTPLNDEKFIEDQGVRDKFSDFTSSQGGSIMLSRFDDTVDVDVEMDVILTTRRSYQREILVKHLQRSKVLK